MSSDDRWCEKQLLGSGLLWLAEPLAACTGIVMVVIFLLPNSDKREKLPPLFLWTKASLVLLGLGTVLFHGMSRSYAKDVLHVNLDMFDWLPLVVVAASLVALYCGGIRLSNAWQCCAYAAGGVWVLFLCICMDSATYNFWEEDSGGGGKAWGLILNAILLLPLFATLVYFTAVRLKQQAVTLWMLLIVSLVFWVVNVAACKYAPALALFHALYHVVMAVALVHAACLGLLITTDEWELVAGGGTWVPLRVARVRQKDEEEKSSSLWLMRQ